MGSCLYARCLTRAQTNMHVDGMEIDLESLFSITHQCVPGLCKKRNCCCATYEIVIDRDEITRIIGYMIAASRYAPGLCKDGSLENIFEEDGGGSLVLDTDEDGLCAFAYGSHRNGILCSLHSVARDLKLPHYKTKPMSCVLWPLALSEDNPLHLSIAEDAFSFPCNTRRKNTGKPLDPNIAQTIRDIFGVKILTSINKGYRKM